MSITTNNSRNFLIKKLNSKFERTFYLVLLSVFTTITALHAQEREATTIYSVEQLSSEPTFRTTLPSFIKPENINPLIFDLKPSVYYANGTYKVKGDKPVRVYLDMNSVRNQISRVPDFDNVEMAIIKIESERDLFSRINLDNLAGFTKLKYVYIVCNVDCTESQVLNSINSSIKNYVIIYNVEKQS